MIKVTLFSVEYFAHSAPPLLRATLPETFNDIISILMGDAFIVSARLGDLLYALGRQKYGKD